MSARPRFAPRLTGSAVAGILALLLTGSPVLGQPAKGPQPATAQPGSPAASDTTAPPAEPQPLGWSGGAVVGAFVAVVIAVLLYALSGGGSDAAPPQAAGARTRAPASDGHCSAFRDLPPAHREFIQHNILGFGETVLWAGVTSKKAVLATVLAVLAVGGGLTAAWGLYCASAGGWDGQATLVTLGLVGGTGFFCVLAVQDGKQVIYLLTPQRAAAVYPVPRGYATFSYGNAHFAAVEVSRHWLMPGVGSLVFPTARAQATRETGGDPGPCGFLRIDRPQELADLIRGTFRFGGDDEPVALAPARPADQRSQRPKASAKNGPEALMDLFPSRK